jgi:hypothetical protein
VAEFDDPGFGERYRLSRRGAEHAEDAKGTDHFCHVGRPCPASATVIIPQHHQPPGNAGKRVDCASRRFASKRAPAVEMEGVRQTFIAFLRVLRASA